MGAKRPPAIKRKAYVEIDLNLLNSTGEIKIIGAPIEVPVITTKVPRGNFEIVYCAELLDVMRKMGNKKIELFAYLLDHKDGNNCINTSVRQLAKKTNISYLTVQGTLAILKDAGLLTQKGSVYMFSPSLMVKGNQVREAYLMRKFEEMDERPQLDILESKIEGQLELSANGDIVERVK